MGTLIFYPVAFGAGLISFVSPCVLPLLPSYLSYISGLSVPGKNENPRGQSWRMVLPTLLFVVGFAIVFSLLGSAFGAVSVLLKDYRTVSRIVAGVVIMLMGIFMTGIIKIPFLYREAHLNYQRRVGVAGAIPLGMAFAVGWTPCVGPILASIYMLALGSPGSGASLLFVYSLGLGVPFVVSSIFFSRMTRSLGWFKRHGVIIQRLSGAMLITIGILLLSGRWASLMAPLQRLFRLPI